MECWMEEHGGDFKTEYDDDLTTSTGGRLVEYLLQESACDKERIVCFKNA
jgi:hypothetical protein